MPPPSYILLKTKKVITLGRELARGGEGAVYDYAMPRIRSGLPLHGVYSLHSRGQKARGFHWRYLHVAARNLASAVAAIHAKGYCVGDLNESNCLVQGTALLTLVDTDSFQVPNPAGPPYLCPVGKADYTAPEIQGQDFSRLRRNEEHDRFALAILVFQILQEGSHPFRGKGGPPELEERIRRGLFPFVPGAAAAAPPLPLFSELAPPLRHLFRAAFHAGHANPGQRPSARDWAKALAQAEAELTACKANPQHHYHRDQGRRTWCARTQALGGIDPFPPPTAPARTPTPRAQTPRTPPVTTPPVQLAAGPIQTPPASAQISIRPPWWRRHRVASALAVLALLVLGVVVAPILYRDLIDSPTYLLAQAREALKRGDEAAADRPLQQAANQAPEQVLAFARDRAEMYRALAKAAGEAEARELAMAEAQQWDERAKAAERQTMPRQDPVGTIAWEMVTIPGGSFQMGCSPGDSQCYPDEGTPHQVTIKSFRLGRYEVTPAQWQAVMTDQPNPSSFKGDDRPVNVSWNDIQAFLGRLNAKGSSQPYRLPTEVEWEYAARAGSDTPYWWGAKIGKGNANCRECGSQWDGKEAAPVGSFKPNGFGLYDTVGNVWEWVQDRYHHGYTGAPSDGSEWSSSCRSAGRVLRGGSWFLSWGTRVSNRSWNPPDFRDVRLGLRLAQDR
ncbi:SUMF1/EgtB/PvdO family nonheme iron enzyme [uncultured Thiodictyon sp.]|uniref:SUMF1/EgtB/PvdO family nonheme iron enzyme n=1 Tax=uncultured Thiodictyon sp. TaxID=1846217 RepID=UPI0025E7B5C7|nr:SUMF1/EgtB/PvdO family nonheme iron enzyme [uncultured Thiodictyon sp.]